MLERVYGMCPPTFLCCAGNGTWNPGPGKCPVTATPKPVCGCLLFDCSPTDLSLAGDWVFSQHCVKLPLEGSSPGNGWKCPINEGLFFPPIVRMIAIIKSEVSLLKEHSLGFYLSVQGLVNQLHTSVLKRPVVSGRPWFSRESSPKAE